MAAKDFTVNPIRIYCLLLLLILEDGKWDGMAEHGVEGGIQAVYIGMILSFVVCLPASRQRRFYGNLKLIHRTRHVPMRCLCCVGGFC